MKFLLQKDILLDFVFAIQKAKEWWDWWKPDEKIVEFVESGSGRDICPIGSLEFCLDYYKNLGINPKPINVPENLFKWAINYNNGSIKNVNVPEWIENLKMQAIKRGYHPVDQCLKNTWRNGMFVKSETKFKHPINGIYASIQDLIDSEHYDPNDRYQITNVNPTLSDEWRYFVYDGKVVGMKCYLPDNIMSPRIPNRDWVLDVIKEIDLPAFTLDVGLIHLPSGSGVVPKIIEVHDFYSCGLYGFDDYNVLPYMFYRSHLRKFL